MRSFYTLTSRALSVLIANVGMLVVRMAAFKFLTVFYLRGQQPRAIRLEVLSTADSFRSSVIRNTIVASPYISVGLTNASIQGPLRCLRTSELLSRGLILMIYCLTRWTFALTALEGSPFDSSTEPSCVTGCIRAMRSPSTVSASGTSPPPMCIQMVF